ncbi:MAG: hypothetical protein O2924_02050 [Chloroflexi bacterium]|nr:hypothetical protein [Chloroflexota bacterium]MQC47799.1 hypothetical protein [Chloroflexota bacterium]
MKRRDEMEGGREASSLKAGGLAVRSALGPHPRIGRGGRIPVVADRVGWRGGLFRRLDRLAVLVGDVVGAVMLPLDESKAFDLLFGDRLDSFVGIRAGADAEHDGYASRDDSGGGDRSASGHEHVAAFDLWEPIDRFVRKFQHVVGELIYLLAPARMAQIIWKFHRCLTCPASARY